MVSWRASLVAAVALASGLLASTARAGHCEYCNYGLPTAVEVKTAEIGVDGVVVVVLEDARRRPLGQTSWDITTVTVTDARGTPVDGALEVHPGFSPAAWRPSSPWSPGVHHVAVTVDLPSFADFPGCSAFTHYADVMVADGPRHIVGSEALAVAETYGMAPTTSLDTLVCCDGARPWSSPLSGFWCPGYPSTEIRIEAGFCTERVGTGWLRLDAEILIDGAPAPADYSLRELTRDQTSGLGDARLSMSLTQPACLQFERLDLVTGERRIHEACHGDTIAGQLGTLALDPTTELAASCSGEAYVCEVVGDAWNLQACTTWPDGDPFVHPSTLPSEDEAPVASNGCRMVPKPTSSDAWLVVLLLVGRRITRTGRHRRRCR
jgi:hypothetical protein